MKVLLEEGVWIADFESGDPARTLVEENAQEFDTMEQALSALEKARRFRPFKNAEIVDSFV